MREFRFRVQPTRAPELSGPRELTKYQSLTTRASVKSERNSMRIDTKITRTLAPAAIAAAIAIGGAGTASAIPATAQFGAAQSLTAGPMVTEYTVSDLRPSDDVVNAPLSGRLWEATVNVDAVQGTVTPTIPFFNARADNGQNYRALYQAPAPEGVSGTPLTQGAETTGKVYFDVTGAQPTSVVYNDAVADRLIWG
jgi:Domain of unknown function (DUF1942)